VLSTEIFYMKQCSFMIAKSGISPVFGLRKVFAF
jgi:hypothetical protein